MTDWEVLSGSNDFFDCISAAAAVYPDPAPSTHATALHLACIGEFDGQFAMWHKMLDSYGSWHPSSGWDNLGSGLGNQGFVTFPQLRY
jgi:hypothetical protein